MPTIPELAREARSYFETAERVDGDPDTRYVRTRDDRPEWVRDVIYAAHGDMFPDDWRYACIEAALEAIGGDDYDDEDAHDFADQYVDVYNGARLAWLGSHLSRAGYVDEAVDEFGAEGLDTFERIGLGQYAEASEVFALVVQALRERAEEIDTEDEGGDDDDA